MDDHWEEKRKEHLNIGCGGMMCDTPPSPEHIRALDDAAPHLFTYFRLSGKGTGDGHGGAIDGGGP